MLAFLLALLLMPAGALQPTVASAEEAAPDAASSAVQAPVEEQYDEEVQASSAGEAAGKAAADEAAADHATSEEASESAAEAAEGLAEPDAPVAHDIEIAADIAGYVVAERYETYDPATGAVTSDDTFLTQEKVVINTQKDEGVAHATVWFSPFYNQDQPGIEEEFRAIPEQERFAPENFRIIVEDPAVLQAAYVLEERVEGVEYVPTAVFTALRPGSTHVQIEYEYVRIGEDGIAVHYEGNGWYPVAVVDSENPATSVEVPADTVDVWAHVYADSDSVATYFYDYVADAEGFDHQADDRFYVGCETALSYAPATLWPADLFEVSIADANVLSAVTINPYGPDSHSYETFIQPTTQGGETDVTVALKADPSVKKTFHVKVHLEDPGLVVKDHEMEVGASSRIYPESYQADPSYDADRSPVYISEPAAKFMDQYSLRTRPFIKQAVSSDPSVVLVKQREASSAVVYRYDTLSPFSFVALSAGSARITLTDYFDKEYTYTVTVKPAQSGDGEGDTGDDDKNDPSSSSSSSSAGSSSSSSASSSSSSGSSSSSSGSGSSSSSSSAGVSAGKTEVTSVALSDTALALKTTDVDGAQLSASVQKTGTGEVSIVWRSSDPKVATVDQDGLVTPVSAGACFITAAAGGKSALCDVKVESVSLCQAAADSVLGAASILMRDTPPKEVLEELSQLTLTVGKLSDEAQAVADAASAELQKAGAKVHGVYDIHLANGDGSEHTWNNADYPLVVRIPMDDEMKVLYQYGRLSFFHVDPQTGERTKMNTWVLDGYVHFETTHFSPFALVMEPNKASDVDHPLQADSATPAGKVGSALAATGDESLGLVGGACAASLLALGAALYARRKMA